MKDNVSQKYRTKCLMSKVSSDKLYLKILFCRNWMFTPIEADYRTSKFNYTQSV